MSEAGEERTGHREVAEGATRAGFVALVGRPNAGKSTLLNALVGEHLAAVSPKAQTTRHRIPGFLTDDSTQFVFVDTPGFLDPAYPLQQSMLDTALSALDGVDVVCWLVDHDEPSGREEELLRELAGRRRQGNSGTGDSLPLLLLLTKSDQVPAPKLEARARTWGELGVWADRLRLSAVTGEGLPQLLEGLRERLPEQPFFYDPDDLTDLNLRFIAGEMVREACYEELGAELAVQRPRRGHGVARARGRGGEDPDPRDRVRGAGESEGDRDRERRQEARGNRPPVARVDREHDRRSRVSGVAREGPPQVVAAGTRPPALWL